MCCGALSLWGSCYHTYGGSPSYESQIPGAPYQRGCFPGPFICPTQKREAPKGAGQRSVPFRSQRWGRGAPCKGNEGASSPQHSASCPVGPPSSPFRASGPFSLHQAREPAGETVQAAPPTPGFLFHPQPPLPSLSSLLFSDTLTHFLSVEFFGQNWYVGAPVSLLGLWEVRNLQFPNFSYLQSSSDLREGHQACPWMRSSLSLIQCRPVPLSLRLGCVGAEVVVKASFIWLRMLVNIWKANPCLYSASNCLMSRSLSRPWFSLLEDSSCGSVSAPVSETHHLHLVYNWLSRRC